MMRTCKKCGETKPLEDFAIGKNSKDGRRSICKKCHAEYQKAWRKSSGYVDEANQSRFREWYGKNREAVIAKVGDWVKKNPGKYRTVQRASFHRRAARVRENGGSFTPGQIEALRRLQKNRCAACEKPLTEYHIDHVMPVAKGGSNDISNIQLLCPKCNRQKSAKHPVEFMQEIGKLL